MTHFYPPFFSALMAGFVARLPRWRALCLAGVVALGVTACSTPAAHVSTAGNSGQRAALYSGRGPEVVMYALGLLDTGYRFGGKNPEAGLDCSGMVTYVYHQAIGFRMTGNAADIARQGRVINAERLRPGDLVFFNTLQRPHSHVGIYIGGNRFIHAPNSNGRVRIDYLSNSYYAQHFEEARAYFD